MLLYMQTSQPCAKTKRIWEKARSSVRKEKVKEEEGKGRKEEEGAMEPKKWPGGKERNEERGDSGGE